jgi:flagellar biosynthetic protein FlhB
VSEEQDDASKTEEPSSKRLADARSKGQVVKSQDLGHFAMLSAGAGVVLLLGPSMMNDMAVALRRFLEMPHLIRLDDPTWTLVFTQVIGDVALIVMLPFLIMLIAAVAAPLLQIGWLVSSESIKPTLDKISPVKGFGRLFSARSAIEVGKGLLKIVIVGAVAIMLLWPEMSRVDTYVTAELGETLHSLYTLTKRLLFGVLPIILLVAILDYFYQRYAFMKQMRMSKQELKDEFKNQEGDPQIKSRLKSLRNQRARKRMMMAVPTATVVVTNPTHYAVALKYDQGMSAPMVVAKGADLVAKRIRDLARENFVPIVENPPLARALFATAELDAEIPYEHYRAVAEVIGYVMRLKRQAVH